MLKVSLISPELILFEGETESVVAPASAVNDQDGLRLLPGEDGPVTTGGFAARADVSGRAMKASEAASDVAMTVPARRRNERADRCTERGPV